MKIMLDSTLRLAESVGLRADVLCMSGGGVGHLANALREDPVMKERNEVVVVTSGNDYIRTEYEDIGDYVFNVDKSLQKLQRVVPAMPDKAVKVLYVRDNPEAPVLPPDMAFKERYLKQELFKLTLPHPTEGGTQTYRWAQ